MNSKIKIILVIVNKFSPTHAEDFKRKWLQSEPPSIYKWSRQCHFNEFNRTEVGWYNKENFHFSLLSILLLRSLLQSIIGQWIII